MPRETNTAEKIEVRDAEAVDDREAADRPRPSMNRKMPAISVVIFESRIVAKALSYPSVNGLLCSGAPPQFPRAPAR